MIIGFNPVQNNRLPVKNNKNVAFKQNPALSTTEDLVTAFTKVDKNSPSALNNLLRSVVKLLKKGELPVDTIRTASQQAPKDSWEQKVLAGIVKEAPEFLKKK